MPLPNTTQSIQQEGRIALAMDALKQGHFTSVRGAAKAYDVVRSTLENRINGHPARRDSEPRNRKLTTTEESTLV
jgi:transposase-like protein